MMILGSAIGVIASISGMYLSYFYNLPSGPAIVLVAFGFFMLAFLFSPSQGILTNPRSKATGQSQLWREIKELWR
jgi:manganese/iron transport system permease protein